MIQIILKCKSYKKLQAGFFLKSNLTPKPLFSAENPG